MWLRRSILATKPRVSSRHLKRSRCRTTGGGMACQGGGMKGRKGVTTVRRKKIAFSITSFLARLHDGLGSGKVSWLSRL